jgi:hypothetical protein
MVKDTRADAGGPPLGGGEPDPPFAEEPPVASPMLNLTPIKLRQGSYAYIDLRSVIGIYPLASGTTTVITTGGAFDVPGTPDAIYDMLVASAEVAAPKGDTEKRGH